MSSEFERLRRGVDESQVGMALLVHHSFPDEIEAANGVITGSYREYPSSTWFETADIFSNHNLKAIGFDGSVRDL